MDYKESLVEALTEMIVDAEDARFKLKEAVNESEFVPAVSNAVSDLNDAIGCVQVFIRSLKHAMEEMLK